MIRTLLDVGRVQEDYFRRQGYDAEAVQARSILEDLRALKRNPSAPDFGRRVRQLRQRQRGLSARIPRTVWYSTLTNVAKK